jgi:hypothetical protein
MTSVETIIDTLNETYYEMVQTEPSDKLHIMKIDDDENISLICGSNMGDSVGTMINNTYVSSSFMCKHCLNKIKKFPKRYNCIYDEPNKLIDYYGHSENGNK